MVQRENLLIEGINTDIFSYGFNCKHTSMKYGKNLSKKEIKSYHWVISFDPKDVSEHGLTVEKAQELGMKFARAHFGGFECIVATHEDGSSGSGNIHVHIAHNSVRCKDVEQPAYSQLERDRKAGYKFHLTKDALRYLKAQVMELCQENGLNQVELNKPAQKNIPDREYWSGKRAEGKQEKQENAPSKFKTELEKLRKAIECARDKSSSVEDFQRIMQQEHGITVKESRGRWSYLLPDREKAITWRRLGEAYKKESIEAAIADQLERKKKEMEEQLAAAKSQSKEQQVHLTPQRHDVFVYGRIIDLNDPKIQASYGLRQWAKIQNLKENARRFAYLSQNNLLNVDRLQEEITFSKQQFNTQTDRLRGIDSRLKEVNLLLRLLGQYLETKDTYKQYQAIKNPKQKQKFRENNIQEILLNEGAIKQLHDYRVSHGMKEFPKFTALKREKQQLMQERGKVSEERRTLRESIKGMEDAYKAIEPLQISREVHHKEKVKVEILE